MVDTQDLFRKLAKGATFRKEKQSSELAVFQPRFSHFEDKERKKAIASALDFFGDGDSTDSEECSDNVVVSETDKGSVLSVLGKKRTRHTEDFDECSYNLSKIKNSLTFNTSEDDEQDLSEGLQLTSSSVLSTVTDKVSKRKKKKKKDKEHSVPLAILKRQEVNGFRNAHRIYVSGTDIPDPIKTFQDLINYYQVPSYLIKNIANLGYKEPTPIQMQAIPLLLHSREVLVCAPTGSGKTAAFLIPILTHLKSPMKIGFRAVIVSPTRELAQQTYRECVRLCAGSGFNIHVLTKATASRNSFGPDSSLKFDILVTTPNRLVHMLSDDPPAISLNKVEWLILDESDKLFEDGVTGFREQVDQIYTACDNPNIRRGLFSATLACGVEEFCQTYLDSYVRITIGLQNSATDTVKQELLFVGQESGKLLAVRDIIHKGFTPPVLVFVQSIERSKELFHELIYDGMNVDVIHSERTQAQRDNVVKSFRDGKIWILICTDLMGRGIDFKGVNLVINYDFPTSAVSYIHRIGRTGRAGREGQAVTFFTEDDIPNIRSIANVMKSSGCPVPEWMLQLKRPSKQKRKMLSKRPLQRSTIRTVSKYDLIKAKKKKEMIKSSKRKRDEMKLNCET